MEIRNSAPIGVFDSGVGGISTLRELIALLPNERFLYYGDDANAPYGIRSTEEVRELTSACVAELVEAGVKAVVLACNTATAAAASHLRACYPDLPIIGAEPALKPAVMAGHRKIGVMATPTTLRESKFRSLASRFGSSAEIIPLPAPGLVELIEQDIRSGSRLEALLKKLLAPAIEEGMDALVLGCTHYPFVRETIQSVVGNGVALYDGNRGIALQTARSLGRAGISAEQSNSSADERVTFCQKGQRAEYFALAERLIAD